MEKLTKPERKLINEFLNWYGYVQNIKLSPAVENTVINDFEKERDIDKEKIQRGSTKKTLNNSSTYVSRGWGKDLDY